MKADPECYGELSLSLLTLVVMVGLAGLMTGCQSTDDDSPYAHRKAGWVEDLRDWYPDWQNPRMPDQVEVAQEVEWAYQLQQWYPHWQAPKVRQLQLPPAEKSVKEPEPVPQKKTPAPTPPTPPRVKPAPPAGAPQLPEKTSEASPAKKEPVLKKAAAVSATAPAAREGFQLVSEDGDVSADGTFIRNGRRYYTIRKGDTLSKIADRVYGDAKAWRRIRHANPYIITDVNSLTVGATIRIP